jgi:hypothetical protein
MDAPSVMPFAVVLVEALCDSGVPLLVVVERD